MKTTKQDSKLDQENEATVSNNIAKTVESKHSPHQVSVEKSTDTIMPLDSVDSEQLTLELPIAETLAMATEPEEENKKRKDKQDQDAEKKQSDIVNDESAGDGQSSVDADSGVEDADNESLVTDALAEQAHSATSDSAVGSGLSITTVVLSALGLIGASSYYKNSNKDLAPEFSSGVNADDIDENSGAGQIVYTAVAIDDAAENAVVSYSLAAGSDSALSINSNTGAVTLADNPDYEVKSQYSFTVIAEDEAGNQSQQLVSLIVTDLDEAAPNITSSTSALVDENVGANQVVYTATANDNGDITDGIINFSLSSGSDSSLTIDSASGEVVLTENPDQEAKPSYNFTVIATDSASNASQQSVTLIVGDLDEIAPLVTSGDTSNPIDENSGSNQIIYTASADDSLDISEGVSFSLSDGSDSALTINPETGVVTLVESPDYESQIQYTFGVIATDAAGNTSEAKSVTLDINNLDDTAPTILSGNLAAAINENSGASQVIYTALADDSADISEGVSFDLAAGSDNALSINSQTGAVTLATNPDQEVQDQFSFTVVATDVAGNVSEKQVTLSINDLDEVAPTINSLSTAVVIENSGADQVIYTATADDSADISNGVTFALADGSDDALSIDLNTGAVTLQDNPDEEAKAEYSFTVIAEDAAGNDSEKAIVLSVGDVDEIAPQITSGNTSETIDENSGSNQIIYTATADDSLDISEGVSFSLSNDSDSALSIDETSGEVSLNQDPDHEVQEQYSFAVIATDKAGNVSETQSVTLAIQDLDDAAPTITSSGIALAVDENSNDSLDLEIYTAEATDLLDDVRDEPITFSLAEGSDQKLTINSQTGVVSLNENPDHETQTQYTFTVVATDAAGNASDGKLVTLDITDLDDVAPLIISDSSISVVENSGAQVIYTVESIDEGDDVRSDVHYALVDTGGLDLTINQETGEVTLATDLDADLNAEGIINSQYSFTVLATNDPNLSVDANGVVSESPDPRLGSVVKVKLDVVDIDDTAPIITSDTTSTPVDENSNIGLDKVIYTATASDTDYPFTGPVINYSLALGSDSNLTIDENTGEVVLTENPDFEVKSQYSFTVVATDGAGNQSEGQSVTIDVANLDDAAPVFTSSEVANAIDENSGENQTIYTAAIDDSSDVSAQPIAFSLSPASDSSLNIDSETGVVTLSDNPNYEAINEYNFTVVATDAAGNSSEQLVTLSINDLDDTAPEITSLTVANVDENLASGELVYTATSDDSNASYSLTDDSDSALTIDINTGAVTLNEDPVYAVKDQYNFTVIATDVVGNVSEQSVVLSVNNIDEADPVFVSLEEASVIENIGSGKAVYQAKVDDSNDISSGITFSLSTSDPLTIDSNTGIVTLLTNPDADRVASYSFTVIATDGANNSAEQIVTLTVGDIDDEAPVFNSEILVAINENIGLEQVIYTALATDQSVINFELIGDIDPALSINALTGEVTLENNPDFESKSSYTFTVKATDTAEIPLSAQQEVTVMINNLDEIAPTITSDASVSAIDENSGASQVIYTASANDSGDTSEGFNFSLSSDSDVSLSIDSITGVVTLASNPNQETQDQYTFTVIATDDAGNASEQELTIAINDLDEIAPTVISSAIADAIEESSGADQVIYTTIADDSGDISSGPITYSLGAGSDTALTIDENTGLVTLTENPVYTIKNEYSFTVIASDNAGNVSDEKSVTLGINETAPDAASISLVTDSGVSSQDKISDTGLIQVDGIKAGSTWEYSLDYVDENNATWIVGTGASFTIAPVEGEGSFNVNIRVTNDSNGRFTDMPAAIPITIDTLAPNVELISADSSTNKVVITYSEQLGLTLPETTDYVVTRNGVALTVSEVNINGNSIELTVVGLEPGPLQVTYTPSENTIEDIAGNTVTEGFTQMIVSDGYIRGAEVYLDRNNDGIADQDELLETVTSDEFGQIILSSELLELPENIGASIIVKGGINMDSGAPNELELTAPAGYAVINPLSTLVQEIFAADVGDEVLSSEELDAKLAEAEQNLSAALGIDEGEDLSTYDPLSDTGAFATQKAVAQIASVLAVASSSDSDDENSNNEAEALQNLAAEVNKLEAGASLDLSKDAVINLLPDGVNLTIEEQEAYVDLENASNIDELIEAQAKVIDAIAPEAPSLSLNADSDSGISSEDALTNDDSPTLKIEFDTLANNGLAVVAGDILQIYKSGILAEEYTLSEEDIESRFVERDLIDLEEGDFFVSAGITDRAGNSSFVSSLKITIDTEAPEFTSPNIAAEVPENSNLSLDMVIYSVAASDSSALSFELAESSDEALSFNAATGEVILTENPDFEVKSDFSFTIIATDAAGNSSEQLVTMNVGNIDDTPPTIISGSIAVSIDENSGSNQIIYTATADDSADISDTPITYSLSVESDGALSIDSASGQVTLTTNPDHETQSQYSFAVIATDSAGNVSEAQSVSLAINDIDDAAPTINSAETAVAIDENSGANQVIYTATADDSADVSEGVTFSLSEGSDASLDIDSVTGEVTLTTDPDHETQAQYSFAVIATDAAGNASEGQSVSLDINDVDDTAPIITSAEAIEKGEGSPIGTVIYTATADDTADISDGVSFSLAAGSDSNVSIDAISGDVSLNVVPIFEVQEIYNFTVVATDNAGNVSDGKQVTLTISTSDDIAPIFTSPDTVSVAENKTAGDSIYTAIADDANTVTYSLADGADIALNIDAQSGVVSLNENIDFESTDQYAFTVVATDTKGNESLQAVTLNVVNIDEQPPTITSSDAAIAIGENSGADQVIYTATADDSADVSDGVSYSLAEGSDA
ncbi:MAG: cadherin domain-containing protein, partial [Porticoccaceae bacterium]|nr:cadherin domain-containing protein [Porticoccaceae bacterium]